MRRVVVSGMGLVSPVGNTVDKAYDALLRGESGIVEIESWKNDLFAGEKLAVSIAGTIKKFRPENYIKSKKDLRRMEPFVQFAMVAAAQAWQQAGLPEHLTEEVSVKAGSIVGVGLSGIDLLIKTNDVLREKGPRRVSPFFIPNVIANIIPGYLSIAYNLKGPNFSSVSACSSANHAIGEAFLHIRNGNCDLMIAGGAESPLHPVTVAGFSSMGALCRSHNDSPKLASRPFDKNRDGFVVSEGAGILVLEEYEHARNRGAHILAEVAGYGASCDAYHITAPSLSGEGAFRAMKDAIAMAGIGALGVDYINAHGTSTEYNDKIETLAIKSLFKQHARNLLISSTKSMTGHLLGAAGGIEAVFSVMSLMKGVLPPTINYEEKDPACDLNYIPNEALEKNCSAVLSNSFGFGGTNAVLCFKKI